MCITAHAAYFFTFLKDALFRVCKIESVYNLLNNPKRKAILILQSERTESDNRRKKLKKKMCLNCWIEHHNPVQSGVDLFHSIEILDAIKSWIDKKPTIKAQFLQSVNENLDFLVSLFVTENMFSLTLPLIL